MTSSAEHGQLLALKARVKALEDLGLLTITPAGLALIDDATASAQLTTLGVTTFIKTLLDDANAAAARTTLELGTSGYVVDSVTASYTANADITTIIPIDNTIPLIGEGTQILSVAISPKSTTNKLRCRFSGQATIAAAGNIVCTMFQGSTLLDARYTSPQTGSEGSTQYLETEFTPGSTSSVTISVRAGPGAAGTIRFNGTSAGTLFSAGASKSTLVVEEIKA